MSTVSIWVRRFIIAALLWGATAAHAEPVVAFDPINGVIQLGPLTASEREMITDSPDLLRLQLANLPQAPSMLFSVSEENGAILIIPRFPLLEGQPYALSANLSGSTIEAEFAVPSDTGSQPKLVSFSPRGADIPANTMRFYLTFSEPMARGQIRDMISIETNQGKHLINPFLNLQTELWDPEQKRLTLLLDPGRIKQGVGPNLREGTPLIEGISYVIIVSANMQSATGEPIGTDLRIPISVGPPERRKIDPYAWELEVPKAETKIPVQVSFDRLIDTGAAKRFIKIVDHDEVAIRGVAEADGLRWTFTPSQPWEGSIHTLMVEPELEDVAGNTVHVPFDARGGASAASSLVLRLLLKK